MTINWRRFFFARGGRRKLGTAGVAAIEFALVVPMLGLLSTTGWDVGNVFYQQERLESAAFAGAAYGIQDSATSTDYAGMVAAARADANDTSGALTITAQEVCRCSDGTTVGCSTGFCSNGALPHIYVQVRASETYTALVNYPVLGQKIALSGQATLRYQ